VNNIGDHGLIGDCHSAALVGRDGSIDWACFPRFDSPSVFAKVLDASSGGFFALHAVGEAITTSRAYVPDTNVLTTTTQTDSGTLEITDCMPTSQPHTILRRARCIGGSIEVEMACAPRGSGSARRTWPRSSAAPTRWTCAQRCRWIARAIRSAAGGL